MRVQHLGLPGEDGMAVFRRLLELDPPLPVIIETVRNIGYRMRGDA